jgi:hypothetical protein
MTKQSLINFYLEYTNNWLTIERMSEYFEMPYEDCLYLVELGRKYHEERVSDLKMRRDYHAI